MPSPGEVSFAPAGKRFEIIGAVDEASPFPVANSSETTPCEADQRRPLAAEEITWLRSRACIKQSGNEAPRSKLRGILSAIAPQPYPPSLLRATARSPRHSSPQQAAEYPGEGE